MAHHRGRNASAIPVFSFRGPQRCRGFMENILTPEIQNYVALAGVVLLAITAILWFFLPFAVFGIKDRMDRQAALTADLLGELQALRGQLRPTEVRRTDTLNLP